MKKNVEKMLLWLESDLDLRRRYSNPAGKAWLTKKIGISGANQMKGAIKTLKFILEEWEE
jgi:hypothetical protein